MSYINVNKVETGNSLLEINLPAIQRGEHDQSFEYDEWLAAASTIIGMLDELDDTEAIVITKVII